MASVRERLLEAAIESLEADGYAHTTTRSIVARAGAALPAVNYHFGSKERLLHEAAVEALRRWADTTMADAEVRASATPRERLQRSLERFLDTLPDDRAYAVAAVEAFAQAERSDELRARMAAAYDDFRDAVAASVEEAAGLERGAAADDVASVLIALFDGLALQWLLRADGGPTAQRVLRGLDLLALALAPDPAG